MKREIKILETRDELAAHAADMIVRAIRAAISSRGKAMLALCGGTTPQATYALLTQSPRVGEIDWSRVFIFLTDERFVPADHPESNFGMLQRTLLTPAGVDSSHAFAVPTELATAGAAAAAYENTLAREFGMDDGRERPPRFDLILLGLGTDGHVASLFPGAAALDVRDRWVVASPPGSLPPSVERVTLTLPVLNAAREILFLVSGSSKAAALRNVLEGHGDPLPAARVHPADGDVTWLLDAAASGR